MNVLAHYLLDAGLDKHTAGMVLAHTYPLTDGDEHWVQYDLQTQAPVRFGAFALASDELHRAHPLDAPLIAVDAKAVHHVNARDPDNWPDWLHARHDPQVQDHAAARWAVDNPVAGITDPAILARMQLPK